MIEDTFFTAEDSVCLQRATLITEGYNRFADRPAPLRRALAFDHVLRHMSLDLDSNPVFAGNTSSAPRAWMLVPEFGIGVDNQVALENDGLEAFFEGKLPADLEGFWREREFGRTPGGHAGPGHASLDFKRIVDHGLESLLTRIGACPEGNIAQQTSRRAMAVALRAVINWSARYAEAAEIRAGETEDPELAACHRRVAAACRHVPARPARNLFEGLQAIALVHLASVVEGQGMSVSIGLPDRALGRFTGDVESDPGGAVALIRAFVMKIASNSYCGRGAKTQAITVGGAAADGAVHTPVTAAFLDAFARTPVGDPTLYLRWHEDLDEALRRSAFDILSRGRSMPLLVNDHQVVPGLIEAGVPETQAWNYCIVGCNELSIPGRCPHSGVNYGVGFNDLAIVDRVIRERSDDHPTVNDILDDYETAVREHVIAGTHKRRDTVNRLADQVPFPFYSACFHGCIEAGDDYLRAGDHADILGVFIRGTSNAVNALAAIETLARDDGRHRIADLIAAVDAGDRVVLDAIAQAPKWGNDDDRADTLAVELNRRRDRALRAAAAAVGAPPFMLCHVVRSLHHLDGARLGNTLDGRAAGTPVGDSIGAVIGTQTEGPTAMLNSVLKLDAARWFAGIYNLNLTLPSGAQSTPGVIGALTEAFFLDGGQELQINVLDSAQLRRAQEHPEACRDLVVRVAGFNARFVELSRTEQDELIRRAEAARG